MPNLNENEFAYSELNHISEIQEGDAISCSGEAFSENACTDNVDPINYSTNYPFGFNYGGSHDITQSLIDNDMLSMFVDNSESESSDIALEFIFEDSFRQLHGQPYHTLFSSENIDTDMNKTYIDYNSTDQPYTEITVTYEYDAAPGCGGNYQLPDNQWQQISLPCYSDDIPTVSYVFGDDIPGSYGIDWGLFRFDATNNQYVELSLTDELELGVGYWILQVSGIEQTLDMPAGSEPLSGEEEFYIELITKPSARQWNMIGYPYSTDKPLSDLRIFAGTESCIGTDFIMGCTLDTAKNENIVDNQIWNFNGESYDMVNTSGNLNPWKGYWVLTLESADETGPDIFFPGSNNEGEF